MSNALITYLHDHLARVRVALEILDALRARDQPIAIRKLADQLLDEMTHDRIVLERLADKSERSHSTLKDEAACRVRHASHWKLDRDQLQLSTLAALETLAIYTLGKLEMWRALRVLQPDEPFLFDTNLERLCERAEDQFFRIERLRIKLIPQILGSKQRVAEVA